MSTLRETAARWLADGEAAVLVEVTEALGSAPREAGTRMLVSAMRSAGTVGGGHLELKAIERRMAIEEQARAAYLHGAEERSRTTLGRPLTPDELERVISRYR